jgi:hypothetical protein
MQPLSYPTRPNATHMHLPLPSLQIHKQPSINQQLRPRHISTQRLASKKHRRSGQIRRLSRASQRYPALHVLLLLGVREILLVQLRLDGAREQRVAADGVGAEGAGGGLDEREDACFGGGVVGLSVGRVSWGGDGMEGGRKEGRRTVRRRRARRWRRCR